MLRCYVTERLWTNPKGKCLHEYGYTKGKKYSTDETGIGSSGINMYGNFCERNVMERLRYAPACRSLLPPRTGLLHQIESNTSKRLLLSVRLPLLPLLRNNSRPLRQLILVRICLGCSTLAGGTLSLLRVPARS